MKKIEKMMVAAVNDGRNWNSANTRVICNENGTFVVLYDTIIFARVNGREYYSDGGWATATTSSRLRALGADYSTNPNKRGCELTAQKDMKHLMEYGQTVKQYYDNLRAIVREHDNKPQRPIVVNL